MPKKSIYDSGTTKGSAPRTSNKKRYDDNWDRIFGKKDEAPNPYGDDDFATPQEDEERMDIIGQNGNDGLHYYSDVEPSDDNNPNPKILNPQPTAKGGIRTE